MAQFTLLLGKLSANGVLTLETTSEDANFERFAIDIILASAFGQSEGLRMVDAALRELKYDWLRPVNDQRNKWVIDFRKLKDWLPPLSYVPFNGSYIVEAGYLTRHSSGAGAKRTSIATFEYPSKVDVIRNYVPSELTEPLERFRVDHPDPSICAFVMMRFDATPLHGQIFKAIKDCLSAFGLKALRADDKRYSDDLLTNIRCYMHACRFGVAAFERLLKDDFNPNVSLEVGYMMAMGKPVCLMKDKTVTALHTDLVGRLYEGFDPQKIDETIWPSLAKWLGEKDLIQDAPPPSKTKFPLLGNIAC